MKQTVVVHWKQSPYDIDIRRPRKWGNPFRIGSDGTRSEVIAKYRDWLMNQPISVEGLRRVAWETLGMLVSPKAVSW